MSLIIIIIIIIITNSVTYRLMQCSKLPDNGQVQPKHTMQFYFNFNIILFYYFIKIILL
jgi:hypothetical protein